MNPDDPTGLASALESLSVTQNTHTIFLKVEDMVYPFPWVHYQNCTFETEPGGTGNGSSAEHAIVLRVGSVSAEEFEAVLDILTMANSEYSDNLALLPTLQWTTALKLAVKWAYNDLRNIAVSYLSINEEFCSDPVQLILYGRDYSVEKWLVDGCTYFVERNRGPREEEAIWLGMNTTIALYDMRENISILGPDLRAAIRTAFEDYL